MRTVHCNGGLGGCLPREVSAQGGVCLGGCLPNGGVHLPHVDRQTLVTTVADGKNRPKLKSSKKFLAAENLFSSSMTQHRTVAAPEYPR